MNLDENGFTMIKMNISLTWQLTNVISVIISELGFHLHIWILSLFVIFYDIAGFERRGFLHVISINLQPADIWFSVMISQV